MGRMLARAHVQTQPDKRRHSYRNMDAETQREAEREGISS